MLTAIASAVLVSIVVITVSSSASAATTQDANTDSRFSVTGGSNNGGKLWRSPTGPAKLIQLNTHKFLWMNSVDLAVAFGDRTLNAHCSYESSPLHGVSAYFVQITEGHDSFYDGPHNMTESECRQHLIDKADELSQSEGQLGFFDLTVPSKLIQKPAQQDPAELQQAIVNFAKVHFNSTDVKISNSDDLTYFAATILRPDPVSCNFKFNFAARTFKTNCDGRGQGSVFQEAY